MTTTVLAAHIGHRTSLLDPRRLRCHDCQRTLMLPTGAGSTSTSSLEIPNVKDPNTCPEHPGEWAATCAPCRSEALELPAGQQRPRPASADPGPEWDALKTALATKRRRTEQAPTPDVDQAVRDAARAAIDEAQTQEVTQ